MSPRRPYNKTFAMSAMPKNKSVTGGEAPAAAMRNTAAGQM